MFEGSPPDSDNTLLKSGCPSLPASKAVGGRPDVTMGPKSAKGGKVHETNKCGSSLLHRLVDAYWSFWVHFWLTFERCWFQFFPFCIMFTDSSPLNSANTLLKSGCPPKLPESKSVGGRPDVTIALCLRLNIMYDNLARWRYFLAPCYSNNFCGSWYHATRPTYTRLAIRLELFLRNLLLELPRVPSYSCGMECPNCLKTPGHWSYSSNLCDESS